MTSFNADELYLLLLIPLLGAVSIFDAFSRRIPNVLVILIAILWLPTIMDDTLNKVILSISIMVAVLGIGMLVWRLGWLGGGDVKLIAALSLWAGPTLTPGLLLAIGASGGVLAAAFLAARRPQFALLLAYVHVAIHRCVPAAAWAVAAAVQHRLPPSSSNETVPYGVAVAAGGCWLVHRLLVS